MATMGSKSKSLWYCTSCGNESSKWMGRCPACGEWNTMVEKVLEAGPQRARSTSAGSVRKPQRLKDIQSSDEPRISLGNAEVDRILGGGIVPGSLVLIE